MTTQESGFLMLVVSFVIHEIAFWRMVSRVDEIRDKFRKLLDEEKADEDDRGVATRGGA